jgi:hypothetical protein
MPATSAPASPIRAPKAGHASAALRPGRRDAGLRPVPFSSSEEAWLWTMAALMARRDGARYRARQGKITRPCEPDDVMKCLDTLYRSRRIDLGHARILRIWGERQLAPNPAHARERGDFRLWREAMERLEGLLRIKGIIE